MTITEYRIRIEHVSRDPATGDTRIIPLDVRCQEIVLCSRTDEPVATVWQVVEAAVELTGEVYPVGFITKDELHHALHGAGNGPEGDAS